MKTRDTPPTHRGARQSDCAACRDLTGQLVNGALGVKLAADLDRPDQLEEELDAALTALAELDQARSTHTHRPTHNNSRS